MPPALLAVLAALPSLFRSRASLEAEVLSLRHQLLALDRQRAGKRVPLRTSDRIFWSWLSRLWPGWRQTLVIIQPETVIRWHRQGFRLYWRRKSRSQRPGRPPIDSEIRELILEMHRANPNSIIDASGVLLDRETDGVFGRDRLTREIGAALVIDSTTRAALGELGNDFRVDGDPRSLPVAVYALRASG